MTKKQSEDADPLSLLRRAGLPQELQGLLADYPRAGWPQHRDFNGLAAFWLDRHLGFRRMLARLRGDAQASLGGQLAPNQYHARLQRTGSQLLNDLIGHHQIEDDAYFPKLAALEPRLQRGFDVLDRDHHDLHDLLDRFAKGANAVLAAKDTVTARTATGRFDDDLADFDRLLVRHLTDEEDLILPVVLKHRVG